MIDFRKVRFTYDGQQYVLDGVDLHINAGQFVCILGGNGSGKSTLAKHVNALLVPDEGIVRVLGHDTSDPECTYLIRSGAGMVFQNPDDQIVASLIENDVAFGPENLGVDPAEIRERVTRVLAQVGLQGFEKHETASLSGGQKQRVAIAGALAMEPKILILDEASAMLDPRGRAGLARVCLELNRAGMTIVMITHFMEEAARADKVFVLEGGKVALEGTPEEVLTQANVLENLSLDVPFAAKMSRALQQRGIAVKTHVSQKDLVAELAGMSQLRGAAPGQVQAGAEGASDSPGDAADDGAAGNAGAAGTTPSSPAPYIQLEGVSFSYDPDAADRLASEGAGEAADWGNDPADVWALRNVDLEIARGRITGIAGHTGSGKSTLIQHMNGLLQPSSGRVLVDGVDIADKAAAHAARADVGLVFQYPEHQLFAATVYEDVAFGPRNLGLSENEVAERVEEAMGLVDLDYEALRNRSPFDLSGGQQRRVAFAGVLAMRPSTLILDEPVAGLDPEAREDFLALVSRLHADQNRTIVLVSHSMDDLARLCDTVVLLNQGSVFSVGTPAQVFADPAKVKAIGLDVPATLGLASALGQHGIPCPVDTQGEVPTIDTMADALAQVFKHGKAR